MGDLEIARRLIQQLECALEGRFFLGKAAGRNVEVS
jgi:hypothetical protein